MKRESCQEQAPIPLSGSQVPNRFPLGLGCTGLLLSVLACGRGEDPARAFRIDERFEIKLWASEQLLNGPVAMALDDKGRAFVLEMPEFPPEAPGDGRVKMLEDTNRDGLPDRAVVPTAAEVPAHLLAWKENRHRTSDPSGNGFATSAGCHVQYLQPSRAPLSISDHGARAVLFPITEDPVYPILTEPDHTSAPCDIVFYSNAAVEGFERALFTAEPIHNLVHCDLLNKSDSIPVARRAREESDFLASTDPLFRPVGFAVGSDKSLYVVDYYAGLAGPTEVLEVGVKPDGVLFHASGKGRIFRVTPRSLSDPGAQTKESGSRSSDSGSPALDTGHTAPDVGQAQQLCEPPAPAPLAQSLRALGITDPTLSRSLLEKRISDPREQDTVQAAAVRSLGSIPGDAPALFLLSRWRAMTSLPRADAMEALFQDPARLRLLLAALEQGQIPLWCLDIEHRVRLLRHDDRTLAGRSRQLLKNQDPTQNPIVNSYSAALTTKGDKEAGERVYKRLCGRCHTFRGGNNYGPDLWTVSSRPRRRILIDILLPNESMAPGRELYLIDLRGGGSVDGIIGSQDPTTIRVLHDESQQETVLRQDIQRILLSDSSAMPVDLASQISVKDMADLLRFLTSR